MAKRFKIEDIDAVGIIDSMRPESEPLTEIPSVENTINQSDATNGRRRDIPEIDEAKCLAYIRENPIPKQLEARRKVTKQHTASEQTVSSSVSIPDKQTISTNQQHQTIQNRAGERTKEEALVQYRQTFLQVPKIEDRKPVFVSCDTRDRLDEIVRRLGGRKMSVSGLIENLARHHLELYGRDIEQWRKL